MSIKEEGLDRIQWHAHVDICGFYERRGILSIWAPTVFSKMTVLRYTTLHSWRYSVSCYHS